MKTESILPWRSRLVAAGAIVLAVWALRVALVGDLGTGIPYADQWEGEAQTIYEPWITGQLSWRVIFAPYLEHRIAWTHLWNLGLLKWCGQWDPMVQMAAQALIPAATAGFCVVGFISVRPEWYWRVAVLLGALLAFGSPLAHGNILWGFQSSFGFLVALSLAGCGATAMAWKNGRYGWLALLAGLAAPLAMGAGALVGPVILSLAMFVMLAERRISCRSGMLAGVGAICFLWGWLLRSDSPRTMYAYAKSLTQWLQVWLAACAWPNGQFPWLAVLACLPAVILIIQILRRRQRPAPFELFLTGLFVWAVASLAGGAWLRGGLGPILPSRYADILTLLCWMNGLALIVVTRTWWQQGGMRFRVLGVGLALAWGGSVLAGGMGLMERFFVTERPTLQMSATRQFDMMNRILDGGVAAAVIVDRVGNQPLPHETVMASRVLAPFLPPEVHAPYPGITPEGMLVIGPAQGVFAWRWQSGVFEARAAAMIIFIKGNVPGLRLALLNQDGETNGYFQPSGRQIGDWLEWLAPAGTGRYRLSIETGPVSDDLAVILPRPLSAAGYWVRWIVADWSNLVKLAGICLAVALLACRTKMGTDENTSPID